jgi:hypothetical protein
MKTKPNMKTKPPSSFTRKTVHDNFDRLSWTLNIETTETEVHEGSYNRFETQTSDIIKITVDTPLIFDKTDYDKEPEYATSADLALPGLIGNTMTLENKHTQRRKYTTKHVEHTFTNKRGYFTCGELIDNIVQYANINRPHTRWFGGIDCHHIFFEGLTSCGKDTYTIYWGS